MLSDRETDNSDEHYVHPIEHFVEAKLRITRNSGEQIDRPSLVRRLTTAHRTPFVLISAPAGYGKSTLLNQWHSSLLEPGSGYAGPVRSQPFAVVALDSSDNDPISFWSTVVHAVGKVCPEVADTPVLRSIRTTRPNIDDTVLPVLLDKISAHCPQLVLALDNYQTITAPECHEQVAYLVHHLPAQTRLVLATRTDPPLPLARLRAGGDIVELRMADLRFSRREVAEVARLAGGHELDGAELDRLLDRTEGWPAMVHLAARLLGDEPDPGAFLEHFGGSNRYVVDYLDEEILRHLPGDVQLFLARTAILDRFTAPLCDAVTGTANSADLLNGLERSNLLLVPLDAVRSWYRYQHLFAEALREQLPRSEPAAVAPLHRKAAAWYEEHGLVGEAVGHALAGGATHRAVELVARHWARQVFHGATAAVRGWLGEFGEDRTGQNPATAICAAWVSALSGERLASRRWLKTTERLGHRGPLPDGMQSTRGAVALYRGAFGFDGVTEMLTSARAAADLHTDPLSPWFAQARMALGYSRYLAGELAAAVHPLEQAAEVAADLPVLRVEALAVLSLVTGELGRSAQAADLAAAARDLAGGHRFAEASQLTLARVAEAAVLVREGHLTQARQVLAHALRVRRTLVGLPPWPTLTALLLGARVEIALGDRAAARALLDEASDVLELMPDGPDHVTAGLAELERRLVGGDHADAALPPLTGREEAVLRLLQGSLPMREIAAELFVTVNTVKSHTRLVYRKLGVSSRAEAIRRARELGLL
jgi:LuxR family maltose regulon positive regulatory protein